MWVTTRFNEVNFSHLPLLHEFSIATSQTDYPFVHFLIDGAAAFRYLRKVRILNMRLDLFLQHEDNMYRHLKSLSVLDLSRSLIGLPVASRIIRQSPLMSTLILKNVQEIDSANEYTPSVDLAQFICGGNVRHLDLSYNYTVSVSFSQWCWNSKLRYLNVDQNFLASTSLSTSDVFTKIFPVLSGIEVLELNVWTDASFEEGLWDDSNIVDYNSKDSNMEPSPLSKLLQRTSFSFLSRYDYWLTDVMKHCRNIKYLDAFRCIKKEDMYSFLMPPLHRDTSELGVVPCGKEIWTRPHGTTRGEKRHTGTPRVS